MEDDYCGDDDNVNYELDDSTSDDIVNVQGTSQDSRGPEISSECDARSKLAKFIASELVRHLDPCFLF